MNHHDLLFLALALAVILAAYQLQIADSVVPSALLLATTSLQMLVHITGVTIRAHKTLLFQTLFTVLVVLLTLLSVLAQWSSYQQFLVWGLPGLLGMITQGIGLASVSFQGGLFTGLP